MTPVDLTSQSGQVAHVFDPFVHNGITLTIRALCGNHLVGHSRVDARTFEQSGFLDGRRGPHAHYVI